VRDLIQEMPRPHTARQRRQAPTTSQPKRLDLRHDTGSCSVREFSAVCFCQKQRNKNKIQVSRMQHKGLCYPMFQGVSHQTAFLRNHWHVKAEHTRVSKYYHCNYWTDIFQEHLLVEILGLKGVWILQKGPDEETKTCSEDLYVCIFAPLRQYEEKIRITAWRHL